MTGLRTTTNSATVATDLIAITTEMAMTHEEFTYIEDDEGYVIEIYISLFNEGKYVGVYIDGANAGVEVPLTAKQISEAQAYIDEAERDAAYDSSDDVYDELRHSGVY